MSANNRTENNARGEEGEDEVFLILKEIFVTMGEVALERARIYSEVANRYAATAYLQQRK